jgi:DNA polymerase III epsilon subunit-like protein
MIIVDIETSGLDPRKHSMLSLGAIDYNTGDEFYGECRMEEGRMIDDVSLSINGFTREQCVDPNKPYPHGLYIRFLEWAAQREKLLAGQQVGSLDVPFLKEIHDGVRGLVGPWPFGYRTVDLHSVMYGRFHKSLSLDGILDTFKLPQEPKPHNALNGARCEYQAFKILLATQ